MLALLLGAPVFAELIQSYLPSTGSLTSTLFVVAFLAPLYGGAAVLIREVALRTGRGWPGRLLLAGAFGVLMPTWVDKSLWTPQSPAEIELWGDTLGLTTVVGVSVFAATSWVLGHVIMSVGVPLVIVEALLPEGRGRAWLGRFGLGVLTVLCLGVATLIHGDEDGPDAETTAARYAVSLAVAVTLVGLAFTPFGRPLAVRAGRRLGRPAPLALAGFALMAMFDLAPVSWLGVALAWLAVGAAVWLLVRCSPSPAWSSRHVVAFGFGAVLERTMIGFLVSPPVGADATGKFVQNVVVLLLVLGLGRVLWVRTRELPGPGYGLSGGGGSGPHHVRCGSGRPQVVDPSGSPPLTDPGEPGGHRGEEQEDVDNPERPDDPGPRAGHRSRPDP